MFLSLSPEDKDTALIHNVGKFLLDTAQHPRRLIRTNKSQIPAFLQLNLSPTEEHHWTSFLHRLKMNANLNSLLTVSALSYMNRLRRTTDVLEKLSHVNGELTPLCSAIFMQKIQYTFLTFKASNVFTMSRYSKRFTSVAGLLARSQYPEGPATGHLGTGFSWFLCV